MSFYFNALDIHNPRALYASEVNQLMRAAEDLSKLSGSGVDLVTAGGMAIIGQELWTGFLAQITGVGSGSPKPYSWQEYQWNGTAKETVDGGRSGTTTTNPAYEFNDATVSNGTYVWMRQALDGHFWFHVGSGGTTSTGTGIDVSLDDYPSSPKFTGITWLAFSKPHGFKVNAGGPNTAIVDMSVASQTSVGIMDISNYPYQHLVGKKFENIIITEGTGDGFWLRFNIGIPTGIAGTGNIRDWMGCILPSSENINAGGHGGFEWLFNHLTDVYRFSICSSASGTAKYAVRDNFGTYNEGVTGTLGANAQTVGGIITNLGTAGGGTVLAIGSTPITGSVPNGLLFSDGTAKLNQSLDIQDKNGYLIQDKTTLDPTQLNNGQWEQTFKMP